MSGRLHRIAATIAAAAVVAAGPALAEQQPNAGTMLKGVGGWYASLFVPPVDKRSYTEDPGMRAPLPPVVNFTASRPIARNTRLGVDVFNVFDRKAAKTADLDMPGTWNGPASTDNYLFRPAEPRGFRLRLRVDF